MSRFRKGGVRCDWCGKFSSHRTGEYTRPVKNVHGVHFAGYIRRPSWEVNDDGSDRVPDEGRDICEECVAGLCPQCGSDQVVKVSPMTPGPYGWGGRCKACDYRWTIPVDDASEED